jgi:hypothetical protein
MVAVILRFPDAQTIPDSQAAPAVVTEMPEIPRPGAYIMWKGERYICGQASWASWSQDSGALGIPTYTAWTATISLHRARSPEELSPDPS